MIDLVWTDVDGGMANGRYRIERRAGDETMPWRLDAVISDPRTPRERRIVESVRCHSIASAQRTAAALEERRARTLRASIHGGLALVGVYAFALIVTTPLHSLSAFVTAMVLLSISVRCAANAVGAKRRDLWGWQPDDVEVRAPSLFERWCERAVSSSVRQPPHNAPYDGVRVLPPD